MQRHPEIVGAFVAGDGTDGVLRALREQREAGGPPVFGIARELTTSTRDGLLRGDLAAVLSHPLTQLAQGLVGQMIEVLDNPGLGLQQMLVPLDTQTPESC